MYPSPEFEMPDMTTGPEKDLRVESLAVNTYGRKGPYEPVERETTMLM